LVRRRKGPRPRKGGGRGAFYGEITRTFGPVIAFPHGDKECCVLADCSTPIPAKHQNEPAGDFFPDFFCVAECWLAQGLQCFFGW